MDNTHKECSLVIGLGGIGQALAGTLSRSADAGLVTVSRKKTAQGVRRQAHFEYNGLDDIADLGQQICAYFSSNQYVLSTLYITTGVLHNARLQPEKKLTDIHQTAFNEVMAINCLLPLQWLNALTPLLLGAPKPLVAVLSARVGSIQDNYLGGWYSYRASKAALNMLIKTAVIELRRRNKMLSCILFHPGTTDTALSEPFQKNVPQGKLFTPEFVANQLYTQSLRFRSQAPTEPVEFIDYKGHPIAW